jgi:hypothetical protein
VVETSEARGVEAGKTWRIRAPDIQMLIEGRMSEASELSELRVVELGPIEAGEPNDLAPPF